MVKSENKVDTKVTWLEMRNSILEYDHDADEDRGCVALEHVILIYCCYQRYRGALKVRRSLKRLMFVKGGPLSIPVYTYRQMEIVTEIFFSELRLGTGCFGTFYVGKLQGKHIIAVKKIRHKDT